MSVQDLTNTKWYINEYPTKASSRIQAAINFNSNATNYTQIVVQSSTLMWGESGIEYSYASNSVIAYSANNSWTSQSYRLIEITGGTDVTNATLIAWLEANATQITVSDLTNTTWLIGDRPSLYETGTYAINFTSNNNQYAQFQIDFPGGMHLYLVYGSTRVLDNYDGEYTWINNAYKTITITGGTDVTNASLISWLEANATLLPTDLTGYTWVVNDTIYLDNVGGDGYFNTFSLSFISNSTTFSSISFMCDLATIKYGNVQVAYEDNVSELYSSSFTNSNYKTIAISGGTDVTNSTLITWLAKNGTLTAPQTSQITIDISSLTNYSQLQNNTLYSLKVKAKGTGLNTDSNFGTTVSFARYSITNSITGGTASGDTVIFKDGTASVTLSVSSGYVLPSSVTVTGATSSYDSTTGVISLSNPTGAVTVTAVCIRQYTITTSVTNGSYSGDTAILANGAATVTISASTGYELPTSITVNNASYTYDSSTGVISLSNPTNNVTITAVCASPQLDAPVISLDNDNLIIEDVTNATSYDIYDGNTLIANVPVGGVPSGYTVTVTGALPVKQSAEIYDGEDTTGTLLGTITGTETKQFIVNSGYICTSSVLYGFLISGITYNPLAITEDISVTLASAGGGSN